MEQRSRRIRRAGRPLDRPREQPWVRAQIRTSRTAIEACWRPCETYQRVLTVVAPLPARRITPPLARGCGCGQPFAAVPQTALCGAVRCGAAVRAVLCRAVLPRAPVLSVPLPQHHSSPLASQPAPSSSAAARPTTSAPFPASCRRRRGSASSLWSLARPVAFRPSQCCRSRTADRACSCHVSSTNGYVFWFHHACSHPIPSPPNQVVLPPPLPTALQHAKQPYPQPAPANVWSFSIQHNSQNNPVSQA